VKVKDVRLDEKKGSIHVTDKGNKREFSGFKDTKQTSELIYALWQGTGVYY
jgi:hypothetical protein